MLPWPEANTDSIPAKSSITFPPLPLHHPESTKKSSIVPFQGLRPLSVDLPWQHCHLRWTCVSAGAYMMQTRGLKLDSKAVIVTSVFTAPTDTDTEPPVYIPVEAVHPPLRSVMEG